MVLNSVLFILFLSAVAVLYYVLPQQFRNAFLLLASYVFYALTMPQYLVLVICSTTLSYFAAQQTDKQQQHNKRKAWLWLSIGLHLAVLCVFKYYGFASSTLAAWGLISESAVQSLVLPLGISFYTFQVIGYNIDVFNKKVAHEQDFITYALFVSFFPQIISGPIGRANELLPQYREKHTFSYDAVVDGLQRFLMGAMKKVVIADGIGILVEGIYGSLDQYRGFTLFVAVILYAIQIYFDFAGYTDMAIGAARILGFQLRENFKAPYLATNLSGFWQRWHMSLTSWLNDYIFTPLVWSRWYNKLFFGKNWDDHKAHFISNIIIVFLISGIWHGSTVNFLIWGLLHGIARSAEELLNRRRRKKKKNGFLIRNLKRLGVFGWWALTLIFFSTKTLSDVWYLFSNLFRNLALRTTVDQILHIAANGIAASKTYYVIYFGFITAALVFATSFDVRTHALNVPNNALATYSKRKRWLLYWTMAFMIMMFYFIALTGLNGSVSFIYANY